MRVKIPRWEIAVICSALLFPGTSLSAQEVGQEEKEVKEMRQDVEQLQQDVRQLREEVRRLRNSWLPAQQLPAMRSRHCSSLRSPPFHSPVGDRGAAAIRVPHQSFPARRERTVETHPEFICRSSEILFQVSSQHLCRPHLWRSLSRFRLGFHHLWRQKATG